MLKSEYKLSDNKTTYVFDPEDSYSVDGKTFHYSSLKKFVRQPNGKSKIQIVTFSKESKEVFDWLGKVLNVGA